MSRCEPFQTTEQAWFWTMATITARRGDAPQAAGATIHPCEPDDVIRLLDALYRRRKIDLSHARVLRLWGERQIPPPAQHPEASLWHHALAELETPLRSKGIVA